MSAYLLSLVGSGELCHCTGLTGGSIDVRLG